VLMIKCGVLQGHVLCQMCFSLQAAKSQTTLSGKSAVIIHNYIFYLNHFALFFMKIDVVIIYVCCVLLIG